MFKLLFTNMKAKNWISVVSIFLLTLGEVFFMMQIVSYISLLTGAVQASRENGVAEIWWYGLYMVICAILMAAIEVVIRFVASATASSCVTGIRQRMYERVNEFAISDFAAFSTESLITRTTNDMQNVHLAWLTFLKTAFLAPVVMVWSVILLMQYASTSLTIVTAIWLVVLVVAVVVLLMMLTPKFKIVQKLTDALNVASRENLTGVRVVRAFNAESYQEAKFEKVNASFTKVQIFAGRVMSVFTPLVMMVMTGLSLSILWASAYVLNGMDMEAAKQAFSATNAFVMLASQIIMSFVLMVTLIVIWPRASVSARRIHEVIVHEVSVLDTDNPVDFKEKGTIEFKPIKDLSIQAVVSPFINYTKSKQFKNAVYYTLMDDPDAFGGWLEGGGSSYATNKLSETRNDNYNVTSQLLVNYNHTFGTKHHFSAMAGFENYVMMSESLTAARDQYELTQYPYLNVGPEDYMENSGSGSEYTSNSFFGRVMYDYADRYLFQANVRHDGSSRFARKYRWGTFPSVSAGWVLSEESFMQPLKPVLSFLKFRVSWGMLGNERIGDNYFPYLALMSFGDALFYKDGNVNSGKTASQRGLAVEDITWETTTSLDLGFDATFFQDRLSMGFDWYTKSTDGMLLSIEIPWAMGYSNPRTNAGRMSTRGWDLELGWHDRAGDFAYSINANVSDFLSRMDYLNDADIIGSSTIQRAGEYYNAYYGYQSDGLFLTQDDVVNSAKLNSTVAVGDVKYKDISGPDGVPDGKISPEYDRVVLGNQLPRFQYGGTVNLSWRNIDFSMAFQGIGMKNSYLGSAMVQPLRDNYGNIPAIIDGKYWSPFNTAEENAAAVYPRLTKVGISNNYAISDYWMFNGAYFRLKNVTLGFTLPEKWVDAVSLKRVRIYASASDLFSLSHYPQGWDPEMGYTSYPITTTVLAGVSIKF